LSYVGAVLVLFAFFNASRGRWSGTSVKYRATNLVGAMILGAYSFYVEAYALVLLNTVWCIVAITGLIEGVVKTRKLEKSADKR